MYTKQPKKLLILNILDILEKYTDADHRLSQKQIADILRKEYDMTADRKAIKRNLMDLIDYGFDIDYEETVRMMPVKDKDGRDKIDPATGEKEMEENYIQTNFYLEGRFTEGELRLLIDGLLFSPHVPLDQCRDLVEKLESQTSVYFRPRIKNISRPPVDKTDNKQLFYTIEMIDEAISKKRKISFRYLEYDVDKELHLRQRSDGTVREYVISPYYMAAREGKYYLICNNDKFDNIANYRLDRIQEIRILDEPVKPFETLKWAHGRTLDITQYMREHPYMFSSDNIRVKFRADRGMITDIVDMFGENAMFVDADENTVTVSTYANQMALEQFARNFAPNVIMLEPKSLVDKVRRDFEAILKAMEEK